MLKVVLNMMSFLHILIIIPKFELYYRKTGRQIIDTYSVK